MIIPRQFVFLLMSSNMTPYNFNGDMENITERQLEFIHKIILELGFENNEVTFETVGVAGDNYVAIVKRIIINDGDSGNINMIAKIAPSIEIQRQLMNTALLFRNEHLMYTEILPKLVQLQKDADVPDNEQFKFAKCYGSLLEPPNEVILLEDLKVSNFTILDRFASLSDECVRSVIKNFAVLHSLSYVLKYKEPETFEYIKINLTDMWSVNAMMEEMKIYCQGIEDDTIATLQDPEHINLIRHKISETMILAAKLTKAESNSKHTVILQGDAWTNNIMFRFQDDNLPESIMIDYQISRNSSPVGDIMYMIFNCTDYETRKNHFYDWMDFYHSELEKSLVNYNLKVNLVYPRDKLDADLKRYGKLMFGLAVCLSSTLIRKSADVEKIMETMKLGNGNIVEQQQEFSISKLDEETITRFKDRIIGLINSFLEFGLL